MLKTLNCTKVPWDIKNGFNIVPFPVSWKISKIIIVALAVNVAAVRKGVSS